MCTDLSILKFEEKEELETMFKWEKIFFRCNLGTQKFHIPEKSEVVNFKNQQKNPHSYVLIVLTLIFYSGNLFVLY